MDIHVYQSALTGHWLVDLHGTKGSPSRQREGFKEKPVALAEAWRLVAEKPHTYKDVVVQ